MDTTLPSKLNFLTPLETKMIRVGPLGDCGYVLPEAATSNISYLYSIGISTNWEFESAIAGMNKGLQIRAFDRTSGSLVFLYIAIRDLFRGDPTLVNEDIWGRVNRSLKYLAMSIRFRIFFSFGRRFRRQWVRSVSKSSDEVAFVDSMKSIPDYGNLLIKIDIEGGEYDLANDLIEEIERRKNQIACIVMELHDTEMRRSEFSKLVMDIQKYLPIVHIHGNNCAPIAADGLPTVVEITFARKDFVPAQRVLEFPRIGLDYPNDGSLPECEFSFSL